MADARVERDLIPDLQTKRVTRRGLLRGATVLGLGVGVVASRPTAASGFGPNLIGASFARAQQDGSHPIRVGMTGDGATLDPASWTNINERHFIPAMFDNLVGIDPDLNLVPGLAASWESSQDNLAWTFHLHDKVTFHDGTACDAEAVAFNFHHVLDEANGIRHRADVNMITAVDVIDRLTVKITLGAPFTPFLAALTEAVGNMSSPAALKKWGKDYGSHPVGTGPFKLVDWKRDNRLELTRFDDYWQSGLPKASGVTFLPIPDTTVKLTNLRSGTIDIVDEIAAADADAVAKDSSLHLFSLPGSRWPMIRLNTAKAPFNNVALRQAVTHAVPRDGLIQAIYFGRAQPAYGPISPIYKSVYDPQIAQHGLTYDLDKAKAKLAEAGSANGFKFTLDVGNTPEFTRSAELIQASLADVGITMEIATQESAAFTERLRSKQFEGALGSWTPRPDVDGTMYQHFHSKGLANWVSYSNPQVDALLDKTRRTPIGEERNQQFRDAERMIIQDAPWVFLVFEDLSRAARSAVTGYVVTRDTILHLTETAVG